MSVHSIVGIVRMKHAPMASKQGGQTRDSCPSTCMCPCIWHVVSLPLWHSSHVATSRPAASNFSMNSWSNWWQGVILYGEPGTGKTLLAKAVANSTSATFLRVVGSELIQKYLGDGPKLVRELFRVAEELAPTIVFIGQCLSWSTDAHGLHLTTGTPLHELTQVRSFVCPSDSPHATDDITACTLMMSLCSNL